MFSGNSLTVFGLVYDWRFFKHVENVFYLSARLTSLINGREYVPFMSVDLKERFAYPISFSDKDGKLALAPKQKNLLSKWVRPEEFCQNPKMIENIDPYSIKQVNHII